MKLKQICNEAEIGELVDTDFKLCVFVRDEYRIMAIKKSNKFEIQKIYNTIKQEYVKEIN